MWIILFLILKSKYLPKHPEFLKQMAKSGLLQIPFTGKAMSKH